MTHLYYVVLTTPHVVSFRMGVSTTGIAVLRVFWTSNAGRCWAMTVTNRTQGAVHLFAVLLLASPL